MPIDVTIYRFNLIRFYIMPSLKEREFIKFKLIHFEKLFNNFIFFEYEKMKIDEEVRVILCNKTIYHRKNS